MKNNSIYAVILAGGSGTRFWPLSRQAKPKQLLNIVGKKTLLQQTVERINPRIKASNILIVTNVTHQCEIQRQMASYKIPSRNILLEPKGKNTAPAIGWAAKRIEGINKDSTLVVLPSDHLIVNKKGFLEKLDEAVALAQKNYLVTFGIQPTRADTGFGYLKLKKIKSNGKKIQKVERFIEKPPLPKARKFLESTNYLWNSGMFIWKTSVILDEYKHYLPDVYGILSQGVGQRQINRVWKKMPSISVDYGILEKSKRVVAVSGKNMGWSDLGSWASLKEVLAKNQDGNIFKGNVLSQKCSDSMIWADKKLIASVGLNNVIVVDTPDALLLCHGDEVQAVRQIVSTLQQRKQKEV